MGNDSDPDGDTVYICNVAGDGEPANGTVVISGDNFVYTPFPSFVGTDSFTYTICDGNGGTSTATVLVVVSPMESPNNPPIAVNDVVVTEEGQEIPINVMGNDLEGPT